MMLYKHRSMGWCMRSIGFLLWSVWGQSVCPGGADLITVWPEPQHPDTSGRSEDLVFMWVCVCVCGCLQCVASGQFNPDLVFEPQVDTYLMYMLDSTNILTLNTYLCDGLHGESLIQWKLELSAYIQWRLYCTFFSQNKTEFCALY